MSEHNPDSPEPQSAPEISKKHKASPLALISVEIGMGRWKLYGFMLGELSWEEGQGPCAIETTLACAAATANTAAGFMRRQKIWVSGRTAPFHSKPKQFAESLESGQRLPAFCLSEVEVGSARWNRSTNVDAIVAELGAAFALATQHTLPSRDNGGWAWQRSNESALLASTEILLEFGDDPQLAFDQLEQACYAELERRELALRAEGGGNAKIRL